MEELASGVDFGRVDTNRPYFFGNFRRLSLRKFPWTRQKLDAFSFSLQLIG